MNYRLVSKLLGLLLLLLSAAMLSCLVYAWWHHERTPGFDAVEAFAASNMASALVGLILIGATLLGVWTYRSRGTIIAV